MPHRIYRPLAAGVLSLALIASVAAAPVEPGPALPAASPPVALPLSLRPFAEWAAVDSARGGTRPWAVLDKTKARLYVFGTDGRLRASTPVLLGSAVGDDSVPGIGDRKISEIRPSEKTTPAGRFSTEPGANLQGEDIVWVDYDAAISMHRVRPLKGERRLQRLATPSARDNRISYGCINLPAAFYDRWVKPAFGHSAGLLYVLPETRPARVQFQAPLPG
ncbi:L,D-transpeptidase [Xylophilus sp. Kf1]|nr:L,D-transpeptidase [Xylophilus sp. Kf1]